MKNPFSALFRNETTLTNPSKWLLEWLKGNDPESDVCVTHKSALTNPTVWRCVNLIAGDVGRLPLDIYRRTPDGSEKATDHAAYQLLRYQPNQLMTASTFKETLTAHALLNKGGRAGIVRDGRGRPLSLIPFLPDRSGCKVLDGQLWHLTRLGDSPGYTPFPDRDVIYIHGLGEDGFNGYDVVKLARNSIGLALAAEQYGNALFKNQARPSIILESQDRFTPEVAKQMLADIEKYSSGVKNTGKLALFHSGLTAKSLSLSSNDAQWTEMREMQRIEIAQFFGVPAHKTGDSNSAGYRGKEADNQDYLDSCLTRWLVKWEEQSRKLLSEDEKRDGYYAEFNVAALLRGDQMTRYRAYQIGIASEFLSPDEVRARENLNKRPDGQGGVYKNPNTRSAQEQTDANRNAVASRLAQMLRVEVNRVTKAAKSKNFSDWLPSFYDRWAETFGDVIEEMGGDRALADHYCESSLNLLRDIIAEVAEDQVADRVKRLTKQWPFRAAALVEAIIEEHECVLN